MSTKDPHGFETRTAVEELVRRLQAFLDGKENHTTLQTWARETWGRYGAGSMGTNRIATKILINVLNAACPAPWVREPERFILRPVDVVEYLRELQRGLIKLPPLEGRELGWLRAPLYTFAERLGLTTERQIFDGVGWYEVLYFASLGSGRVFSLMRLLETQNTEGPTGVTTEVRGNEHEALLDLFESLEVDLADMTRLAEGLDASKLPRWTLWRSCGDGECVAEATFTGFRKAKVALAKLPQNRLYWLEMAT